VRDKQDFGTGTGMGGKAPTLAFLGTGIEKFSPCGHGVGELSPNVEFLVDTPSSG